MNTNCIFGLLHFYDITYIIVGLGPSPNPNSNPTDRKGVVPSRRIDFLLDWKKHKNVLGIRSEKNCITLSVGRPTLHSTDSK